MSPYEIMVSGSGNEHFNKESGKVWLERAIDKWPSNLWINPIPIDQWDYSHSISLIKEIFSEKMVPLTIKGLEKGIKVLSKRD